MVLGWYLHLLLPGKVGQALVTCQRVLRGEIKCLVQLDLNPFGLSSSQDDQERGGPSTFSCAS